MKNMSFALTTEQIRNRIKTVTRRVGWWDLKAGKIVQAVEKAQGLKRGEKVKPICRIRIRATRQEPLRRMIDHESYGFSELCKEGFSNTYPAEFVKWFAKKHNCHPEDWVNRIEFEYV